MKELDAIREKIVAEIKSRRERIYDALLDERLEEAADAILSIPEIKVGISLYMGQRAARERGPNDPVPMA